MKVKTAFVLLMIVGTLIGLTLGSVTYTAIENKVLAVAPEPAQKRRPIFQQPSQVFGCVTTPDLDCGAQLDVGKRVFYTPTAAEGCDGVSPQGCKFIAEVTGIPTVQNPDGTFDHARDSQGRILIHLSIGRPGDKGGSFDKINVPFTSGTDGGTSRPMQSEDNRGVF
jgi:hypothetical protein